MRTLVYGYGLMGQKIVNKVNGNENMELVGVVSPFFDHRPENVPTYGSLKEFRGEADVIIDFSHPNNLDDILDYCVVTKTKLVLATTGLSQDQLEKVEDASKSCAIFQSYNTSFGIQMVTKILKQVAKEFYDNGFDIEIMEKHHNQKIDAPSGTAILLYDVMNEKIKDTKAVYDRSQVRQKREKSEIGISAMRGGTIFGEHQIMFAGLDEIVELKHTALSKDVFVQGSIAAAISLADKEAGLYTLKTLY